MRHLVYVKREAFRVGKIISKVLRKVNIFIQKVTFSHLP